MKAFTTLLKTGFNTIIKTLAQPNPAIFYNFVRDLSWTYVTFNQWGFGNQGPNTDPDEQFYAQWLYPTLLMSATLLTRAAISKCTNQPIAVKKEAIALVAASCAIPTWNSAGALGLRIGEEKFEPIPAAYFAGLFSGIAEGFLQELITTLGTLWIDEKERKQAKNHPLAYPSKKLGLSISYGAIPGAIWQWVYVACTCNNASVTATMLSVALIVGSSNYCYAKVQAFELCGIKPIDEAEEEDIEVETYLPLHVGNSHQSGCVEYLSQCVWSRQPSAEGLNSTHATNDSNDSNDAKLLN